jgi:hypothetical protein
MSKRRTLRSALTLLTLLPVLALLLMGLNPVPAGANGPAAASANTPADQGTAVEAGSSLFRFTSAGHVLNFSNDGMMIASGSHMLKTEFINANPVVPQSGAAEEAETFSRVTYSGLWKGVDLVYSAEPGSIVKSTYYVDSVAIGESVDLIRLQYNRPVSLDESGSLVMAFDSGSLTESRPIAWQEIDGRKRAAEVSYLLYSENELGFAVEDYLPGLPLVIDPSITWNTFLGGSNADSSKAIALDSSGNVYVAGSSNVTWGSPKRDFGGGSQDAFVAKLNSSGVLTWNTFLGGTGVDWSQGIAVDGSGNVIVTGGSDGDWGSPVQAINEGSYDGFAAKLSGSDGTLTWNTFLGGVDWDDAKGIAVDSAGDVYVAGDSNTTWGTLPVRSHYTGTNKDAFAAKLDGDNGALTWNTFLGGSGADDGIAIAVDSDCVYISGYSDVTWKGASNPLRAHDAGSNNDAFAAVLGKTDGALAWNTFLGGSGGDYGSGIAFDSSGNIYIAGYGNATWGSPQRLFSGTDYDAFAAKLNSSGALTWNTFLGSSGSDNSRAIAVDGSGNVYVTGYSDATWGSPLPAYSGGSEDAFAAKLDSSGVLTWNAFMGGSGVDEGWGIAVDSAGIYITGESYASWGSPLRNFATGTRDCFVARLSESSGSGSGSSSRVGGKFTPVDRLVLIVPLLALVSGLAAGGSFLVMRRRKGNYK